MKFYIMLLVLGSLCGVINAQDNKTMPYITSPTSGNFYIAAPTSLPLSIICYNVEPLKGETEDELANRIVCRGEKTGHYYKFSRIEDGRKMP